MFNFVFDRFIGGRPYPNLAPIQNVNNGYHGLGDSWPWITPLRLLYYAKDHNFPVRTIYINEELPENSFYPVGLGWFDYSIDYFSMMSTQVLELLRTKQLKVLFYYHEGDSPYHEKRRLTELTTQHNLPNDCYCFISGNTSADNIPGFIYFPDHELFYWRNGVVWNDQPQPGCDWHDFPRSRDFTILSRVHKWWRATVLARLHQLELLKNSYWSYNNISIGDLYTNNPIEIDSFNELAAQVNQLVDGSPYACDTQSEHEHNNHWNLIPEHFENSYCNLVLETLYDAEQSRGAFLTEKTFKPIRHAQPFIIFGCPNSLKTLRSLGYQTFDHVMDNSYDSEQNNTQRFIKTIELVTRLANTDLKQWIKQCQDDCLHNQQLFVASKFNRLNALYDKLLY